MRIESSKRGEGGEGVARRGRWSRRSEKKRSVGNLQVSERRNGGRGGTVVMRGRGLR